MSTEYSVFDEDVDMKSPDLDADGEYLLEVKNIKYFNTRKAGKAFIVEFLVRESSVKGSPVGSTRSYKVFDADGTKYPDAKGIKIANVRGFMGAALNKDPRGKEKWGEAVEYAAKTNALGQNAKAKNGSLLRGGAGVLVRCKTGKPRLARSGSTFHEHDFSPNVEDAAE